jgi:SAM-dependent methyltransferase
MRQTPMRETPMRETPMRQAPMTSFPRYIDEGRLWGRRGFVAFDWQCRTLFGEVGPPRGRALDIGAGEGLMSLWMLHAGATEVTSLEPEAAGSTNGIAARAAAHRDALQLGPDRWEYRSDTLQSFAPRGRYRVILSHASVNHLDEDACVKLDRDPAARARYIEIFTKIRDLLEPGGAFVVADCARDNYWARLGRPSPWAPEIEWHKHQEPTTWTNVLAEAGLKTRSWLWLHPYYGSRNLAPLLNNRVAARCLASSFVLRAQRED